MKTCPNCGQEVADDERSCHYCHTALTTSFRAPTPTPVPVKRAEPARPAGPPTNGLAVASLIVSFFSLLILPGILAIVLALVALSQIKKSGREMKGQGLAVAGLAIGGAGIVVWPALIIIGAIAIPSLIHSRMAANQAAAITALRTLNTEAVVYDQQYNRGFPTSLKVFGPPPDQKNAPANADYAELIDGVLASGLKSGYQFNYTPFEFDLKGCPRAYTIHADPVQENTTGQWHYFTDETGIIRRERGKPANKNSPPVE